MLRPLRLVSRNKGMKLIVDSLFKALPDITSVLAVILALQSVFAILGMQLYMGTFASCTDPTALTPAACAERAHEVAISRRQLTGGLPPLLADETRGSLLSGYEDVHRQLKGGGSEEAAGWDGEERIRWTNPIIGSFDNFPSAMRLLYIMSTGDEWETPMFSMMAATSPGEAPVRNDSSPSAFFAVAWMFLGAFFAMELFVGVIVDSFAKIQAETGGSATMTKEQQQWVNTMQAMSVQKPNKVGKPACNNTLGRHIHAVVTSSTFDAVTIGVIVANVGVMACDYWRMGEDAGVQATYNAAMGVFAYLYYLECVLTLACHRPYLRTYSPAYLLTY